VSVHNKHLKEGSFYVLWGSKDDDRNRQKGVCMFLLSHYYVPL